MTAKNSKNLDANYEINYNQICISARDGFAFRKMHKLLEKNLLRGSYPNVLEIGAHHGEHQQFVKHPYERYVMCDLEIPSPAILASLDARTLFEVGDACSLKYDDESFDRVISTCVLHHVHDPEKALSELLRVTRIGGILTLLIPTDPGVFYRLIKELGSGVAARKYKVYDEMKLFHAREHKNNFPSILTILKSLYKNQNLVIRYWPFRIPFWNAEVFLLVKVKKIA
jgi:phosphatidylethanolamine/phosphatidyl-N-methylethanolamine N-methyltransferase